MWHDLDPCPLPDGAIVFASTRSGARDEYHANSSRSLFRLNPDGSIRAISYHITAESDPRLMADGRIAFVRYDNFSERAKVESHIHSVRPDGTASEILLGPDRGAIGYDLRTAAEHDAHWLRVYGFGAPSPLSDGRIAALSHAGPVITRLQSATDQASDTSTQAVVPMGADGNRPLTGTIEPMPCNVSLIDISPTPDNRILAATFRNALAVVEPETGRSYRILQSTEPVHSVNFLGEREKPRVWPNFVNPSIPPTSHDTKGTLFTGSVFNSKQTEAEWDRVRAVRIFMGKPLTLRSARHQYGHIGTVGVDLGIFPIMSNGSFTVTVPADMPLAIQAVDAEGRAVVNELSWIYTRPGEIRACIGCHADRNATPETVAVPPGWRRGINLTVGLDSAPQFRANNGANGGVLNLQLERMRETIAINLHPELSALEDEALSAIKSDTGRNLRPVVRHLINELQTADDPGQRFAAVQRMGILRPCGVASVLSETMLGDSSNEVRMIAALTLASSATPETVPMLLKAFADQNEHVGRAAHITLEHMTGHVETAAQTLVKDIPTGDRRAYWESWFQENSPKDIEEMNAAFLAGPFNWTSTPDSIRFRKAVDALAHYGTSESMKALLRRILAEETEIDLLSRLTVIRTLGILRDESSIPILTDILVDSSEKKRPPARHSHEFGWVAMPDHTGGAIAEALGRIATQEALDGLVRGFKTLEEFWFYTHRTADHSWLMGSVSAIIHYRILEAFEAIMETTDLNVKKVIDELADPIIRSIPIDSDRGILLDNDDYERLVGRLLARSSLYDVYMEACLDILEGKPIDSAIKRTVSDSPPAVSTGAMEPTSRAAMVIAVLVNNRTSEVHRKRIRAVFADFQQRTASRERSWVCFMLARALGRMQDRESIPSFLACLTDEKREFDFGSPPPPNVFLHHAMTPVHRASVAAALGMIGDPISLPALLTITEDFHNAMDVRDAAAFAIQEIGRRATTAQRASVPIDFVQRLKTVAETCPELYTGKTLSKAHAIWAGGE